MEKNKETNIRAREVAAEYYLEALFLQYNTLLFNCEKMFMELINFRRLLKERMMDIMVLSAQAQMNLHIDSSLEPKLDRLLAQKVKPQAMLQKANNHNDKKGAPKKKMWNIGPSNLTA